MKGPGGCKKHPGIIQDPQGRAKGAEYQRKHSTEHTAEDLCGCPQQGTAQDYCEKTEDRRIGKALAETAT